MNMPAQENIATTSPVIEVKKQFKSIKTVFLIAFLSLITTVVFISNGLNLYFNFVKERNLVISDQSRISQNAGNQVKEFIDEKLRIIKQAAYVNDLIVTSGKRELVMNKLMGMTPSFRQLLLVDLQGKKLQEVSRLSSSLQMSISVTDMSILLSTVKKKENYISEVNFDQLTQEPIVVVAVPAKDIFGDVKGVLLAEVNLKFMWDLVGGMKIGEGGLAYVIDKKGNLIAFIDISRVLKRENLSSSIEIKKFLAEKKDINLKTIDITKGIQGTSVVETFAALDSPDWIVVVEKPVLEAYESLVSEVGIFILVMLGSMLGSILMAIYLSKIITRPITDLADAVGKIEKGDLETQINVKTRDEIGMLALSFNQMVGNLKRKIAEVHDDKVKLQASIGSLPIGFIMTDMQGNIVIMNGIARSILCAQSKDNSTGVVTKENLGHFDCNLEEMQKRLKGIFDLKFAIDKAMEDKKPLEVKELALEDIFLRIFIVPIVTVDEKELSVVGSVVLVENITERKIIERSRDEFFSIASHELRTPLTSIRGNTALIRQYYWDKLKDKDLREMVLDIHESSTRLIGIVNDFLDTSRLELGKMEFKKEEVDMELLVKDVLREYVTTGSMKKLYLKAEKPKVKIPLVIADKDRVKQIMINLIGNGIKFTEKGGITMALEVKKGFVKVLVSDTGKGISPESQNLLFRKFQQAAESIFTRDAIHGTGLGLYISKMMAEAMGGKVKLESSVVDKGSVFSISMPTTGKVVTEEEVIKAESKTAL
jgi:signal transduction histidine kinase/HAMP domain-containing protein